MLLDTHTLGLSVVVLPPSWSGPSQAHTPLASVMPLFCALSHKAAQGSHSKPACALGHPLRKPAWSEMRTTQKSSFCPGAGIRRGQSMFFPSVASFTASISRTQGSLAQARPHIPVFCSICFSGFSFLSFPGSRSVCIFWDHLASWCSLHPALCLSLFFSPSFSPPSLSFLLPLQHICF